MSNSKHNACLGCRSLWGFSQSHETRLPVSGQGKASERKTVIFEFSWAHLTEGWVNVSYYIRTTPTIRSAVRLFVCVYEQGDRQQKGVWNNTLYPVKKVSSLSMMFSTQKIFWHKSLHEELRFSLAVCKHKITFWYNTKKKKVFWSFE